jgi:hypothetical protein
MMHLAMHDALNTINWRYQPYLYKGKADPSAAPTVAIAAAARHVLIGVIPTWGKPEQRAKALALVETAYTAVLAKLPNGPPKQEGIAIGQKVAAAILAAREADGANAVIQYTPGDAPGKWRPHPNPVPASPSIADPALAVGNWPALLPHWGQITPFTLLTPSQFRLSTRADADRAGRLIQRRPSCSLRAVCSRSLQDAVKKSRHLQSLSSIEMGVK